MRTDEPRLTPLPEEQWSDEAKAVLAPMVAQGRTYNIFKTLARHPALLKRWLVFANHILGKSTLSARDREILILRIGWLCQAEYEWGQHVLIGRESGLNDAEIQAIKVGAAAGNWSPAEKALLAATDDLHRDAFISDGVWALLTPHFREQQLMDIVFTVGQYNLVSMALNSLGVPLDDGLPQFND